MKKYLRFIILASTIFLASTVGNVPAKAICWSCVGHWFQHAADTVAHAFQDVGHVFDDVVDEVTKVADSAVQLAETAVDTISHLAATAVTVVTNVAAAAAGDITGDHTLFNTIAGHIDTAIAGAEDEVEITTNALASLTEAGLDTVALATTHPALLKQIVQYEGTLEKDRLQAETQEAGDVLKEEASLQTHDW